MAGRHFFPLSRLYLSNFRSSLAAASWLASRTRTLDSTLHFSTGKKSGFVKKGKLASLIKTGQLASLLSDSVFKRAFGKRKDNLQAFLNDMYDEKDMEIKSIDNVEQSSVRSKAVIYDISAPFPMAVASSSSCSRQI